MDFNRERHLPLNETRRGARAKVMRIRFHGAPLIRKTIVLKGHELGICRKFVADGLLNEFNGCSLKGSI